MQNKITQTEGHEFDLSTSEGGRGYIADLFRSQLKRHDFTAYINERLAADFACALSRYLKPIRWELERYRLVGCTSCDGSGHLHSIIGDYHGPCVSCAAYELEQAQRTVGSLMHERDTLKDQLAVANEAIEHAAASKDSQQKTVDALMADAKQFRAERDALRKKLDAFAFDEAKEKELFEAAMNSPTLTSLNTKGDYLYASTRDQRSGWMKCAKLRAEAIAQ